MKLNLAYDDLVNAFRLWNIWSVEHPDDVDPPDDSKQCAIEQADLLLHYLSLAEQAMTHVYTPDHVKQAFVLWEIDHREHPEGRISREGTTPEEYAEKLLYTLDDYLRMVALRNILASLYE